MVASNKLTHEYKMFAYFLLWQVFIATFLQESDTTRCSVASEFEYVLTSTEKF